jgi:hypothetical protein
MNCKIKILTNLGTNDFPESPYHEGQEPTVTQCLADKLIQLGLATLIEVVSPPVVEAQPPAEVVPVVEESLPKPKNNRGR